MRKALILLLVLATAAVASERKKEAWRRSGHSWRQSGRQLRRALGKSLAGEGDLKGEWKATGKDLGEAGKDTGKALGRSIQPDPPPAH